MRLRKYPNSWQLEKIPHAADKTANNKAFKGTGFERVKSHPNWFYVYSCIDEYGTELVKVFGELPDRYNIYK